MPKVSIQSTNGLEKDLCATVDGRGNVAGRWRGATLTIGALLL